ncbi:unnamed protein product [Phytomonas sp. EM1]|nr:unnamed protein product [Phytomonas sp. EM1]|eukprot:CCW65039.1 unnamed protein product [Phytomonas sp. isolate EM1]
MDIALCGGLCFALIGSLYVYPRDFRFLKVALRDLHTAATDASVYIDRDSTSTIIKRSISFTGVICGSFLYLRSVSKANIGIPDKHPFVVMLQCVGFTAILFLGPIVEHLMSYGIWSAPETINEWLMLFRNIFLCPFGEEIVFRGLFFHILRGRTTTQQILLSSILFSLSHAHLLVVYAIDEYRMALENGEEPKRGLERMCWLHSLQRFYFHFFFTFVFGILNGFYYTTVCRGSVFALGATHALCNVVGAPSFQFARDAAFSKEKRFACGISYAIGVALWCLLRRAVQ